MFSGAALDVAVEQHEVEGQEDRAHHCHHGQGAAPGFTCGGSTPGLLLLYLSYSFAWQRENKRNVLINGQIFLL